MLKPTRTTFAEQTYRFLYTNFRIVYNRQDNPDDVVSRSRRQLILYRELYPEIYVAARETLWEKVRYEPENAPEL